LKLKRFKLVDYIIVGHGLSGSILANELIDNRQRIVVYDTPATNISSMIAAGLFNPIRGRRFVKTWKADQLFPFLTEFYKNLERQHKSNWYFPISIFRPFLSAEEREIIISEKNMEEIDAYVHYIHHNAFENAIIRNTYGGIFLRKTGYINIPDMISGIRKRIIDHGEFIEELFEYDKVDLINSEVRYNEYVAPKIIFCDGVGSIHNPYFSWLPFRPVKGEILMIKTERKLDFIFNRQLFILPVSDGLYKVGATYDWENINTLPSMEGKKSLEVKLNRYLKVKYSIIDHRAGIRPATKDRRPFIGLHPVHNEIGIFNGMRSKGVSLAPYFARMFVEYLIFGKELDKEVNIKRYY
jgi:glycine/D-amino acid oxidase-like deaminating enzyme